MGTDIDSSALLKCLIDAIKPLESVAVGFSAGVDSSVVVAAAVVALGAESVLAITAESETLPARELEEARLLAAQIGAAHEVIQTREIDCEDFTANSPDRCYHCKSELWTRVRELASQRGIKNIADGVNADDPGDFRPGIRASDECGVVHPLMLAGAGKQQVRQLARELGLPNWDKPAQACLSSRFPYGNRITPEGLRRVEQAEEFLKDLGFTQLRVRDHGDVARIEIPVESLADLQVDGRREKIVERLKKLGYTYVTLDLEGFRSGSMNEGLSDKM